LHVIEHPVAPLALLDLLRRERPFEHRAVHDLTSSSLVSTSYSAVRPSAVTPFRGRNVTRSATTLSRERRSPTAVCHVSCWRRPSTSTGRPFVMCAATSSACLP